jgi:hypothetical protein
MSETPMNDPVSTSAPMTATALPGTPVEGGALLRRWIRSPFLWLSLLLLGAILLSVFLGRYPQPYWMSPALLQQDAMAQQLVFNLRLPRILTAVLSACRSPEPAR